MKLDIFQFHEYREFIKAWLERERSSHKLSQNELAEKLGITTALFSMILNRKRNISSELIDKLSMQIKLSKVEKKYFEYLSILNDSPKQQARIQALNGMKKLKKFKNESDKEYNAYTYLTNWIYVAVREATQVNSFKWDAKYIQKLFWKKVSLAQIKKAMSYLVANGFIRIENNKVILTEKQLECYGGIYKLSLAQFHKQMFEIGIEAIEKVDRQNRQILGHTLALSQNAKEKINLVLKEALEKVIEIEKNDKEEKQSVYHVGLAGFMIGKASKNNSNES